jgi:hypothetical protein
VRVEIRLEEGAADGARDVELRGEARLVALAAQVREEVRRVPERAEVELPARAGLPRRDVQERI